MQVNPKEVIERAIISNVENPEEQIQQVGIDLTIKRDIHINMGSWVNLEFTEKFNMQDTFGLIRIRSSLARKGLILQSGIFDPGFNLTSGPQACMGQYFLEPGWFSCGRHHSIDMLGV